MAIKQFWRKWGGVVLFVGITVAVLAVSDWAGCTCDQPRVERLPYAGWAFEIFGIILAAFGIADRLEVLKQDGLIKRFLTFLRGKDVNVIVGTGGLKAQAGRVSARQGFTLSPTASVAQQIQYLMERADRLQNAIDDATESLRADIVELKQDLEKEITAIRKDIGALRQQTVEVHAKRIGVELAALLWIGLGVTMATVPDLVVPATNWFVRYLEWIPC